MKGGLFQSTSPPPESIIRFVEQDVPPPRSSKFTPNMERIPDDLQELRQRWMEAIIEHGRSRKQTLEDLDELSQVTKGEIQATRKELIQRIRKTQNITLRTRTFVMELGRKTNPILQDLRQFKKSLDESAQDIAILYGRLHSQLKALEPLSSKHGSIHVRLAETERLNAKNKECLEQLQTEVREKLGSLSRQIPYHDDNEEFPSVELYPVDRDEERLLQERCDLESLIKQKQWEIKENISKRLKEVSDKITAARDAQIGKMRSICDKADALVDEMLSQEQRDSDFIDQVALLAEGKEIDQLTEKVTSISNHFRNIRTSIYHGNFDGRRVCFRCFSDGRFVIDGENVL